MAPGFHRRVTETNAVRAVHGPWSLCGPGIYAGGSSGKETHFEARLRAFSRGFSYLYDWYTMQRIFTRGPFRRLKVCHGLLLLYELKYTNTHLAYARALRQF
jgi:hypothetical protein